MSTPVQTVYAFDPSSRKVCALMQVDPEGWLDAEVEPMLENIVRVANAAQVRFALAISIDSSFVLRSNPTTSQFEIDEVETSELLSPHPLHPDPGRLVQAVLRWCKEAGAGGRDFMSLAQLPRRAPEIVELLNGAELETIEGQAQPMTTFVARQAG